jgi:hypothetical protein
VQARETAAGREREQETDAAGGEVQAVELVAAPACLRPARSRIGLDGAGQHPARVGDHDGEQVGHVAEQVQQHVGEPGAHDAALVQHRGGAARVGPARIVGGVARQGQQQIQRRRRDEDEHALPRTPGEGRPPDHVPRSLLPACLSHQLNSFIGRSDNPVIINDKLPRIQCRWIRGSYPGSGPLPWPGRILKIAIACSMLWRAPGARSAAVSRAYSLANASEKVSEQA